jgi:hypothetical protein
MMNESKCDNCTFHQRSFFLSETDKQRIRNGELASVLIPPEFFEDGDYSHWQANSEETKYMTYEEFQTWLVEDMKKYDSIVLYSDGTIYGNLGGIARDIDYDNFGRDVEIFIKLAEEYGKLLEY